MHQISSTFYTMKLSNAAGLKQEKVTSNFMYHSK